MSPRLCGSTRLAAVLALACTVCPAQQSLGGLTGTLTDPTGARVPNATVRLQNEQTGATLTATSSSSGGYTLVQVPSGTYTATVAAPGFETTEERSVVIQADRTVTATSR